MTNLSVFEFEGQSIRWVDGKPVANDVAVALGYADPAKTVSTKVDPDNRSVTKTVTLDGKHRSVTVLEEAGIYQLIFGSKLASAKAFQKWVFSEVLPSIRKTGGYGNQPQGQYNLIWFDRLKLYKAKTQIPVGWFSIFQEMTHGLIADFEHAGYSLPDGSVPDISVGRCFCGHLRGLGYDTRPGSEVVRSYKHYYPDGRIVDANIYADSLLPEYRLWFERTYKPFNLPKYMKGKDPQALPTLCTILRLPEGSS